MFIGCETSVQEIKQDFIEHKLDDRVMLAIVELIAVLEFLIDDFDIEVTISKLLYYNITKTN